MQPLRPNVQRIIHRIYAEVYAALWAMLCAGTVYFLVFIVPHFPEIAAKAELQRIRDIAAEDNFYCNKWGMPEGTPRFISCTLDLHRIRAEAERRISSDDLF